MNKAGLGNYQQKPIKVEAWKFDCYDEESLSGLHRWVDKAGGGVYHWNRLPIQGGGFGLEIVNIDGKRFLVRHGEYVVKGSDGKFYCCESDYFNSNFNQI